MFMRMNRIATIVAGITLIAGATSCNLIKKTGPVTAPSTPVKTISRTETMTVTDAEKIIGGEWTIYKVGNNKVTGENRPYINFNFADSRIYGSNGCNIINGNFAVSENNGLRITDVISTMMSCPDAVYEQAINRALDAVTSYRVSHKGHEYYMDLMNGDTQLMTLRKHNMDFLNGTWQVVEIEGTKYDNPDLEMVIDVQELRLHGNTGCNIVNGKLLIDPDKTTSIQFNDLATTRMMCPPETMQVETAYLVALEKVEYAHKGRNNTVQLLDKNNKPVMTIKRVEVDH